MATIIENNEPMPSRSVLVNQDRDNGAGWAVAILVLVAIIVAGAFWYMRYYNGGSAANGSTVQVNLPSSGYAPANNNSAGTQPSTQTQTGTQPATQTQAPATTQTTP